MNARVTIEHLRPEDTLLALNIAEDAPWEHKDGEPILIPLGHGTPHPKTEEHADDFIITHLEPMRFLTPDADQAYTDYVRLGGWLYVFVNGFLWREVLVAEAKMLRDVDLRTHQGRDERPASGIPLDKLTLLQQIKGEPECVVQIAFSEVQWSWNRINALGGMDPEDPRCHYRIKEGDTLSQLSRRFPGSSINAFLTANDLDNPNEIKADERLRILPLPTIPENAETQRTARMGEPINFAQLEKQKFDWYVADPIGVVEDLGLAAKTVLFNHQMLLNSLHGEHLADTDQDQAEHLPPHQHYYWHSYQEEQAGESIRPAVPALRRSGEHWRQHCSNVSTMAEMIYSGFFDDENIAKLDVDQREQVEDTKKQMSLEAIEDWLHVKERKAMRKELRALKLSLNQALLEKHPSTTGFFLAMSDYAYLPAPAYVDLWARLNELVGPLLVDPNGIDHRYDLPSVVEAEQAEDTGECLTFLVRITQAQNDGDTPSWCELLFPTEDQINLQHMDEPDFTQLPKSEPYSLQFRPAVFAESLAMLNQQLDRNPTEAMTARRLFDVLDRSIQALVVMGEKLPELPEYAYNGDVFLRLLKGSGMPILKNLQVTVNGAVPDGSLPAGQYSIQEVINTEQRQVMKRAERKAELQRQAVNPQRPLVTVMDTRGRPIGGSDFRATTPYLGPTQAHSTITDAKVLFTRYGRISSTEAMYRSRTHLVLVPNDTYSQIQRNYNLIAGRAAEGASSMGQNVAYRGFPTLLLGLEVLNLSRKGRELAAEEKDTKEDSTEKKLFYGEAIVKSIAASFQAREAWMGGARSFTESLNKSRHSILRLSARTLPFGAFKVPIYSKVIFVAALIDFGYSMRDSYQLFKKNDFDAAATLALGATMFLVGAAVGVKAGAMAVSGVAASSTIPFIGWVCAVGGIGFMVWSAYLRDTPLEYWGINGPFSRRPNQRLSQDDLANSAQALLALQNLLMSPSVTLKRDTQREETEGGIWVTADYIIPAFMLDASEVFTNMAVEKRSIALRTDFSTKYQTFDNVVPQGALELPANNTRPYTLRCYYRMDELPGMQPYHPQYYYQWLAKVRHKMSADVSLPLNPKSTDAPGWSETTL